MKIQNIIAEVSCGANIEMNTIDQFVLGSTLSVVKDMCENHRAYTEYRNLPWDKRSEIDAEGNKVIPEISCPEYGDKTFWEALNKVVKFVGKFAIEPSKSNIFED